MAQNRWCSCGGSGVGGNLFLAAPGDDPVIASARIATSTRSRSLLLRSAISVSFLRGPSPEADRRATHTFGHVCSQPWPRRRKFALLRLVLLLSLLMFAGSILTSAPGVLPLTCFFLAQTVARMLQLPQSCVVYEAWRPEAGGLLSEFVN